ncbi:hypothetical protein AGABI1DRAFT_135195 [Agaricus bisporus var. burnettii JB137-S8]|uniref:Uncharacterized protein n=1 Tax=Agaricus bisporus var. burnettii (strain JB137-S8 / ATCC MYA-4627 / FGSC 10392) TaxID=597362 RepID=K5WDF0_AGABU|nr:uncharacterized protein AGABI1DRAFT_135195 [Agaricus bisporus var. burnettii JB137-S8]EKM73266.1 hypothetical protein AGABI1DRAFT_135195 [Agaricus bisporus var. burnettii JB137-S8]
MAQATDLPIELYDLILFFLPLNHAEQVQWRRAAAAIGREDRPYGTERSRRRGYYRGGLTGEVVIGNKLGSL